MADHDDDLPDHEAVDLSNDLAAAQVENPDPDLTPDIEDADDGEQQDDDGFADEGDEDDLAPTSAPVTGKRKKQTAQERIEELARARRAAEQEVFDLELENARLRAQYAPEQQPDFDPGPEPDPKDFAYGSVDGDYLNAMVDWRVKQREKEIRAELQAVNQQVNAQRTAKHYQTRLDQVIADGAKKHKDFADVIATTNYGDPEMARAILDSDNPVDIAWHLAHNTADLRAMAKASPAERARLLGRLEGRYSAASAVKKRTGAPATPGTHRRTSGDDDILGDQDAFDAAFFR